MSVKRICLIGLLIAVSMLFSYVESVVVLFPQLPGFKIGLANISVLFCMYKISNKDAALVLFFRILLVGFVFSSFSAVIYSLCGGILSFCTMVILRNTNKFSIYAISAAGGVAHNIGQLIAAMLVLKTGVVFSYLPVLIIIGTLSGILIGIIASEAVKRINMNGVSI